MRLAVVGGTGSIGSRLCAAALAQGHQVLAVSRRGTRPRLGSDLLEVQTLACDLAADSKLPDQLTQADVIFDLTNSMQEPQTMVAGAQNLLAALEGLENPAKVVCLGIINCHDSTYPYYRAKTAQANIYANYSRGYTLKAAQFFSFPEMFFSLGKKYGCLTYPAQSSFQLVSEEEVVQELLGALEETPAHNWELVGPETVTSRQIAQRYRAAHNLWQLPLPFYLGGPLGQFFRAGKNLSEKAKRARKPYTGHSS